MFAGSLGAAPAIKELIAAGKLKGTVRFYGTPAEEDLAGKVYMARAGLFNDLDVCLDWHPDYENKANMQSSQAIADYTITFKGKKVLSSRSLERSERIRCSRVIYYWN
jgi:aminobenzoyl-glutamate utilization protein B